MNQKLKCIQSHNHLTKDKIYDLIHIYSGGKINQTCVINDLGFEEYFSSNILKPLSI